MIRRLLWRVCRLSYIYIAKPILFLMTPDFTHKAMIVFASMTSTVAPFRWFVKLIFLKKPDSRLIQEYFGIRFNNPVGLTAGLDKNGQIIPTISALGFGFSEVGSVTARVCAGNPRPWFYRLPKSKSLVVHAGLGNQGSAVILKRLSSYKTIDNYPVVLSVAKTNCQKVVSEAEGINDYITTIKRARINKNVSIIEINISCPNAYGGESFTTPAKLERLLKAIDKIKVTKPIWIKMPIDLSWDSFNLLLNVIVRHPINGVVISNLFKDRTKIDLKDILPNSVKGNMSGKPTYDASNHLIRNTYINYGDKLKIIGVGGIFTAEDAYTKIKLGASLVELVTGMIFIGPQIAAEINDQLSQLITSDGYDNICQVIGVDSK